MDDLRQRKRKGHNQKDDSSKRGPYREFDEDSAQARKALIGSHAEKVIAHAYANGGSCRRGFVKSLVDAAARVASALQITRLDINNDVRRIRSKSEAAMIVQREVSPYESFALLEPTTTMTTTIPACAASDTLSLMSSNAEENTIQELQNETPSSGLLASSGLSLLASAAAESNSPKLPNRLLWLWGSYLSGATRL
jgi:hypothetical protein